MATGLLRISPAPETVELRQVPSGPGVRVDTRVVLDGGTTNKGFLSRNARNG